MSQATPQVPRTGHWFPPPGNPGLHIKIFVEKLGDGSQGLEFRSSAGPVMPSQWTPESQWWRRAVVETGESH